MWSNAKKFRDLKQIQLLQQANFKLLVDIDY